MSGGFAGRLGEQVTIMRQADGEDAFGAADGAWAAVATRRAAVRPDGIADAVAGEAESALPRYRVSLRVGVDVRPGDRLDWGGRVLAVRAVIVDPALPDRMTLKAEALR